MSVNVHSAKPVDAATLASHTPRVPHGRKAKEGTILAARVEELRLRIGTVAAALNCSERQVYNFFVRKYPVPKQHLARLCDLIDMDPEDFLDDKLFLLRQED